MKALLRFCLIFFVFSSYAQPYGNEWINYSQSYYSFPIVESGIYRISQQDLLNASIPVQSIDPRNIQLFARGEEIPIFIQGESDGVFDVGDYIEFYASGNDGWLDSVFYKSKAKQANLDYSLINDTINYYFSWNSSTSNRRLINENAVDFGNYFPAQYILKESKLSFNSNYFDGKIINSGPTDPDYDETEGWMDSPINLGGTRNYQVPTPNRYSAGPLSELTIRLAGQSDWQAVNNGDHHLSIEFAGLTIDEIFDGYLLREIKQTFSSAQIIGGNNLLRIRSINDRNSNVDRTAVASIKVVYPHSMSFSNNNSYEFYLDDHMGQTAQYLEILFFNGGNNPVLYDLSKHKRIKVVQALGSYKAIVPNGGGRKKCYISSEASIKSTQLKAVNGTGAFVDYLSLATDSADLLLTTTALLPEVSRYQAYRISTGDHPMTINVEELYHQFGYGINKNPLAIRNFVSYAIHQFNTKPNSLFLIGKSISAKIHRKDTLAYQQNLVPTYGNPASDNLLTAGITGGNYETALPQGRISASSLLDIGIYLNKVIEYETAPLGLWMKKAAHFAGGLSLSETNFFTNYLNSYQSIWQSQPQGGSALLFKKNSAVPIQTTLADSIRNIINNGVSLMTFFGHAATTGGFDISIDSPDKLNNRGKYPLILANSCFTGNFHQAGVLSTSEQYVLERNKGAIGFIASGSLGFPTSLNTYSNQFYQQLANLNYGATLGEIMRETVLQVQANNSGTSIRLVCLEMSLQGDPLLRLNPHPLPDFSISLPEVSIQPKELTSDLDSFAIHFSITNLGRAIGDSLFIEVQRSFLNSSFSDTSYLLYLPSPAYKQNYVVRIPVDQIKGIGENSFSISVDAQNAIMEISELNNRVDFTVLIRAGELIPVFPYDFSIIGYQGVKLKASTAFALEKEFTYQFQLDTSATFDSPLLEQTTLISSGGLLEWKPNLLNNMQDSMVYFWRVSKVPQAGGVAQWRASTFQYLLGQEGWSQSHYAQLKQNDLLFMNGNDNTRLFDYVDNVKELSVFNYGNPSSAQLNDIRYAVDSDTRERNACGGQPGFLIAVLDSLSLDSWETPYGGLNQNRYYGQANADDYCAPSRTRPEKYFLFRQADTSQMFAMRDFLNNIVPINNYVVVYTWRNVSYSDIWDIDSSILRAFEGLGSQLINGIADSVPFIFTTQKGQVSSVMEIKGSNATDDISLTRILVTSSNFGEMNTKNMSFSPDWKNLAYSVRSLENNSKDSVTVELIALEQNGEERWLSSYPLKIVDTSISFLANNNNYKGLKLKLLASDDQDRTPPQLNYWQITHEELPDLALAPNIWFKINKDTLQEGENLEFEMAIKNPSQRDMDSLEIAFSIFTNTGELKEIFYPLQAPLKSDSVFISKLSIPTRYLVGPNQLIIEANPKGKLPEKHRFNNYAQLNFFVKGDRLDPLMDVTFDGRHILNRELVSSKPEILIRLDDENQYLAIDDTSSFSLFITYPGEAEQLINFGLKNGTIVEFVPGKLPDNRAMVRFQPNLEKDGIYQLRVQSFDKSGNSSGKNDYRIEFEVVNESSITRLLNYPNPFSTSTKFVFTLTGSVIPDQMQIQIMTVTGKVVREISQDEIGPIHIGNNISQFSWDGKDEYGDQLANGVYLYRVKTRINGAAVKHRDSNVDQFFTKEFGKMFLLR